MPKTMKSKRAKHSNAITRTTHETGKHYSLKDCRKFYQQVTRLSIPEHAHPWDILHAVINQHRKDNAQASRKIKELTEAMQQQTDTHKQLRETYSCKTGISQRLLQETESQLLEEVEKLFQLGGIAMPAKVFSGLLSTVTEHFGQDPDNSEFELTYLKECTSSSVFIMECLCTMYDIYERRKYYLSVIEGKTKIIL